MCFNTRRASTRDYTVNRLDPSFKNQFAGVLVLVKIAAYLFDVFMNFEFKHLQVRIDIDKGQLISECLLGVIDFPKKQRKI